VGEVGIGNDSETFPPASRKEEVLVELIKSERKTHHILLKIDYKMSIKMILRE
jgi:hypothetical protein